MSIFSRTKPEVKPTRHFHHIDRAMIDRLYFDYAPIFVLSTGRAGSRFVVEALSVSPNADAVHEPPPTLMYFSDFAHRHRHEAALLTNMINAVRMERVLEALHRDKVYVESNQCLTFFADALAGLFKGAKFVHLVRDPRTFVVSAIRKGWHANDSIWEAGRVRADEQTWDILDQVGKLAWVWQTTTAHLAAFGERLPTDRFRTFQLEDLGGKSGALEDLIDFAGLESVPAGALEKIRSHNANPVEVHANEPETMRKQPDYPAYDRWPADERAKLEPCAELAARYGYDLSRS